MSLAQSFMALFEGSDIAHGQTTVGNKRRNGKTDAKSFIVKKPLTLELVEEHLQGKRGVGSIPINDKNKCKFAVLDIDTYPIDHAQIFPKQDEILVDRGDVGNFINLPYFDADNTLRYALNDKGKELKLQEFIELANKKKTSLAKLEKIDFGTERQEFNDAPFCIKVFFNLGIPEGQRNKVMFHAARYAKLKFPEEWKQVLETWNQKYCSPPLPASEIVIVQQQHQKKEYAYLCKEEPMVSHCDRALCKSVKYGIGNTDNTPNIGGLTILKSEPRLFFLDVDGKRLELSTEQLQMPIQFQRACMDQIDFMPPLSSPKDWQVVVNNLLASATTIEVPEELTITGQFRELLEIFCTSRIRARSVEELVMGKPWTESDLTYFTMKGLQEFLKQRGFTSFSRPQIQQRLKDMNNGQTCNGIKQIKLENGEWKNIRVWWIPEYEENEVNLTKEEKQENDEIPF